MLLPYQKMRERLEVGIWSSPKNTPDDYRILRNCGVTHAFIDENYCKRGSAEYLKILSYCEEAGLKAYLFNYNDTGQFLADMTPYSEQEAFAGIVIYDEPSAEQFDELASIIPEFERRYPEGVFYVNLLPNYGVLYDDTKQEAELTGCTTYERYIEDYCEKVLDRLHGKKILSVDFYPLVTIPEESRIFLEKGWLRNLEIVAKCAKEHGALPYWYIQSTSFGHWRREPMEKDFSYQYFVCLAYGARGINHFTYTSPLGGEFAKKDIALIDRDNKPTEKYFYVKELNQRMQQLCEELFDYDYVGTMAFHGKESANWREKENIEELRYALSSLDELEILSTDRSLLVAEFEKYEAGRKTLQHAYLLVNFTDPAREEHTTVTMRFQKERKVSYLYKNRKTKKSCRTLTVDIESGEGIFLCFQRNL